MQTAFMSEMRDRLRQARKLAGYRTIVAATEAHGLVYSTYACHEGGARPFKREAPRYAKLFRVNLTWLVEGTGAPRGKVETHPVVELYEQLPPEKQKQAIEYKAMVQWSFA